MGLGQCAARQSSYRRIPEWGVQYPQFGPDGGEPRLIGWPEDFERAFDGVFAMLYSGMYDTMGKTKS